MLAVPADHRLGLMRRNESIDDALQALRMHTGDADNQQESLSVRVCRVVCILADLALNAYDQEDIVAAGGIDAVLRALDAHRTVAGVQEQGCAALINLAANAENQVKIVAAGGIGAVRRALNAHPTDAAVQEHGRGLLDCLGINAEEAEPRSHFLAVAKKAAAENVQRIVEMGYTEEQAEQALDHAGGSLEEAVGRILAQARA